MKKILLTTLLTAAFATASTSYALVASDNGGNYVGGWTNGANGGTGFGAWSIVADQGTGFAGNFIGNPSDGGISGMATNSFALYANPDSSGAFVDAGRTFASALSVGDTFSFQWGMNWDSDGSGNKGFNLYSGGLSGTQILNINMGGSATISINASPMFTNYGTNAFTLYFTIIDANTLGVYGTGRDGSESYTNNFDITGLSVDSFKFYASNLGSGNNRQPYFNDLEVVPEPSTYVLLALSAAGMGGYVIRRRRR